MSTKSRSQMLTQIRVGHADLLSPADICPQRKSTTEPGTGGGRIKTPGEARGHGTGHHHQSRRDVLSTEQSRHHETSLRDLLSLGRDYPRAPPGVLTQTPSLRDSTPVVTAPKNMILWVVLKPIHCPQPGLIGRCARRGRRGG